MKYYTKYKKGREVIGVAGCEASSGVTHLCFCMANYLANVAGRRTAIINLSGDYKAYRQAEIILAYEGADVFDCGNITVFGITDSDEYARLPLEDYERVVLDLGCKNDTFVKMIPYCDKRIFMGRLNEWNYRTFLAEASELFCGKDKSGIIFASAFFCKRLAKSFSDIVGCDFLRVPLCREPFRLHGEMLTFMQNLLDLP